MDGLNPNILNTVNICWTTQIPLWEPSMSLPLKKTEILLFFTYIIYTLCLRKKRRPFYICENLVRCHLILPILGRNIPEEI